MVSLVKNQTVSLSKESSALSQLHFGLGWDPVKKKGLLGGLFGGNDSIDLDAGCVLMDSTGKTIDTIWFRKLESTCGAVVHSGDNLTGEGGDGRTFKDNVFAQVQRYFNGEAKLPRDAKRFIECICYCTRGGKTLQIAEFERKNLD